MELRSRLVTVAVTLTVWMVGAASAAAATCESLNTLTLPQATVTAAELVKAGTFTQPAARGGQPGGRGGGNPFSDLGDFCRVAVTVKPTADSDIKMEVWLPLRWNNRMLVVGNGGWNGNIDRNALATGLRRGYAVASTDTGHEGGGGPWMANEEKLIDFGYRAVHETTARTKTLINAYYGKPQRFAYFQGCSAGGRQGLKSAQKYPEDFDGIVAGAPALNTTGRAAFAIYAAQALRKEAGSYIPSSKYPAINRAVLQACDTNDGIKDDVLDNPRACKFDPKVLECKAGTDNNSCLTPAQVTAARALYQPLKNSRTGALIFTGLEYGSEMGWSTFGGQQPFATATQMYQQMIFKNPAWDYKTLNFDSDMALVDSIEKGNINAMDPNLGPFLARGGKLIQYHGWADQQIPPGTSPEYYDSVVRALGGADKVDGGYRLFMVPGMAHCGGGNGTSTFDVLAALERWVELKSPPDQITATRVVDGRADRQRMLCRYPAVASYKGTGEVNEPANFVCK
jgi:feruloyl esterase